MRPKADLIHHVLVSHSGTVTHEQLTEVVRASGMMARSIGSEIVVGITELANKDDQLNKGAWLMIGGMPPGRVQVSGRSQSLDLQHAVVNLLIAHGFRLTGSFGCVIHDTTKGSVALP